MAILINPQLKKQSIYMKQAKKIYKIALRATLDAMQEDEVLIIPYSEAKHKVIQATAYAMGGFRVETNDYKKITTVTIKQDEN